MTRTVVAPERAGDLIGLALADLEPGQSFESPGDLETVVVVLGGVVEVEANGKSLGSAGGRSSVFEGPGHAVYAPPGTTLRLTATTPAQLAIATAPAGKGAPARRASSDPADQRLGGSRQGELEPHCPNHPGPRTRRRPAAAGRDDQPARQLVLVSAAQARPRGARPRKSGSRRSISSRSIPPDGFGVQIRYDDAGTEAFTVRDGDVAVIRSGYHPVVAAPGYSLYYLWVMAGEGRQMIPHFDPAHAWVQES